MQFNKSVMTAALFAVAGFTAVSGAHAAGTATGQFDVKMTITSACTVSAASGANDIDFGDIAAGTALADGSISNKAAGTALSVSCSTGAPYVINLTAATEGNTTGAGTLTGEKEGKTITYQLHSDATGTKVWGNTGALGVGAGGNGVTGTGTGITTAIEHLVYATITGSTDVAADNYKDTVNVSVVY